MHAMLRTVSVITLALVLATWCEWVPAEANLPSTKKMIKLRYKRLVLVSVAAAALLLLSAIFAFKSYPSPSAIIVVDDRISTSDDSRPNSTREEPQITLEIHVFFRDDLAKLDQLWKSIDSAHCISSNLSFTIHALQMKRKGKQWLAARLNALRSRHGRLQRVHLYARATTACSLVPTVWMPKSRTNFAIFLEHDTTVSPHFLVYSEAVAKKYLIARGTSGTEAKIMGVSLHSLRYNPVNGTKWDPPTAVHTPYLLQYPQTHGMVISPVAWVKFVSWIESQPASRSNLIPESMTNRWHEKTDWRKDFLKYMYLHGVVTVVPHFPDGQSLISRQRMKNASNFSRKDFEAPLLNLDNQNSLAQLSIFDAHPLGRISRYPSLDEMEVYDVYFQRVESFAQLSHSNSQAFDKCALIINTYDRVGTLLNRIYHYQSFPLIDRIIIVWNHQTLKPHFEVSPILAVGAHRHAHNAAEGNFSHGDEPSLRFQLPVHIKIQTNSSLNNRYIPFPEIQTDCVISMDDDFDFPHSHLAYSISLFQGHFFNHAIGFRHTGRSHVADGPGRWLYSREVTHGASIVLPSGLVFHRKYLDAYTYGLPRVAHALVDSVTNGEDILFNLVVANATGACPVVVNLFSRGIKMSGLWQKQAHFEHRSEILTRLVNEVYGGKMPLKYSTVFFKGLRKDGLTPSIDELKCV